MSEVSGGLGMVGGHAVPDTETVQVAEGVHAFIQRDGTWWISNAGVVVGEDAALLVDTCTTPGRTRDLFKAADAARGETPLRFAVNTHHHGDHTFGNSLLADDVCLIGHDRMREGLLADQTIASFPPYWSPEPDLRELRHRPPTLTIGDSATVHLGGRSIQLQHPGYRAHTAGDVVVWVPDVRVLFVGDLLFPGHTPMILAGSPAGAIKVLDWILGFDADVVVPGHGEVVEREALRGVLDEHRRYYRFVLAEAERGVRDRLTPLEVAQRADLGEFADLYDSERFVLNVHSAYAEREGRTTDRAAAFADVMTWIGSAIPTKV